MGFIIEIFSEKDHLARLVTTLIATITAVLVLYYSHVLSKKRTRSEFLIGKLEELIFELQQMQFRGVEAMAHNNEESGQNYYKSFWRSKTLLAAYVPKLEKELEDINSIFTDGLNSTGSAQQDIAVSELLDRTSALSDRVMVVLRKNV